MPQATKEQNVQCYFILWHVPALHNTNMFEYFKDILDRLAKLPDPGMHPEILRELLPDKWFKKEL